MLFSYTNTLPFLTNGGLTILAETILFRISISHNPSEPFGTLASAMALPMVGEKVPEVTSPSPLLVYVLLLYLYGKMFYFFLNSLARFIIQIDSKYYGSKKTKVEKYNSYF